MDVQITCPACHKPNLLGTSYCRQCGNQLATPVQPGPGSSQFPSTKTTSTTVINQPWTLPNITSNEARGAQVAQQLKIRSPLWLIIVTSLVFVVGCSGRDINIKSKTLEAAGIHITYNDKATELEEAKAEIAALRAYLAAKDSLTTGEVQKLREQMITLQEKVRAFNEQLVSLQENNANLRENNSDLQEEVGQLRQELAQERAAREAAEQRADETERANAKKTVWHVAAIANRTNYRIIFWIWSDTRGWEKHVLDPRMRLTVARQGEGIHVRFCSEERRIKSVRIASDMRPHPTLSNARVNYFGEDDDGYIDLFSEG